MYCRIGNRFVTVTIKALDSSPAIFSALKEIGVNKPLLICLFSFVWSASGLSPVSSTLIETSFE